MFRKILIALILVSVVLTAGCGEKKPLTADELLSFGEKYLLELEYEQAVVYFEMLIEIEPMNPRGYSGMAEAYFALGDIRSAVSILERGLAVFGDDMDQRLEYILLLVRIEPANPKRYLEAAEIYLGRDDGDSAIRILRRGISASGMDPDGRAELQGFLDGILYEIQRKEAVAAAEPVLEEIALLCSVGDYGPVFDKTQTADYEKVTGLVDFLREPYLCETPHGRIGVYGIESEKYGNYMIYYGDYNGDVREGSGIWLGYFDGNSYFADCKWRNDAPNGFAKSREWNANLASDVFYRVISGNAINGLWDGGINWDFDRNDGYDANLVYIDNGRLRVTEDDYGDNVQSGDINFQREALDALIGIVGFGNYQ